MRRCLCPGTFDPITLGHLDIIRRAGAVCDEVIVLVLDNDAKRSAVPLETRRQWAVIACGDLPHVTVDAYEGLLVDYAARVGATLLVRGVRSGGDLPYEHAMALANRTALPSLETVWLPADGRLIPMSSSIVRAFASLGGSIDSFVPASIVSEVAAAYRK